MPEEQRRSSVWHFVRVVKLSCEKSSAGSRFKNSAANEQCLEST